MKRKGETKNSPITHRIIKVVVRAVTLIPLALFSAVLACDIVISHSSADHIYSNIKDVPYNEACIVLGTTPYRKGYKNGNPYFNNRINAAAQLYKNKKVKYIIASGDSSKNYNEVSQMRKKLIKQGVPAKAIKCDTKGHSTIESMQQAKKRFNLKKATIVSQPFHNERAIFIAQKLGIEATGYNAKDINIEKGYKVYFREKLARVKVFIDLFTK